jgi:hypothetical protein
VRSSVLRIAKAVLPDRFIWWYRRRRTLRRYFRALAIELYDRQIRLDIEDLEGRIALRRHGFYERVVKDVLDRTELILQALDRRIEAVSARHGNELRALRDQLADLRAHLEQISAIAPRDGAVTEVRSAVDL